MILGDFAMPSSGVGFFLSPGTEPVPLLLVTTKASPPVALGQVPQ